MRVKIWGVYMEEEAIAAMRTRRKIMAWREYEFVS
jgi:hypothetical protein